jgi:peptidyl-prolyl isomerase D
VAERPADDEGANPETLQALKSLGIQLHLNSALVQLRVNNAAEAIKSATNALEIEGLSNSDKAKAYYRRGQAYGKQKEEELAIADLKKALDFNPNDGGVLSEYNAAKTRQKSRRDKEKKAYSKMFS